ncbi:bifunctional tetrahydrofolate synthase/dihydrofolate synthase [Vibrio sp.]|nr:bifunctional tetrahydrofolate synthase/dihydrofolate synthase [Vibrio sp.]
MSQATLLEASLPPQATSSLDTWLDYLNSIHTSAIDLGLERAQVVADTTSLTKPAPIVITVAGTNGKGSTCAILESILLEAGYRVGVYSSPHLIRYNERIRINGINVDDQAFIDAFDFIEQQRGSTSLSFFEFGTLAALKTLKDSAVDIAILEVGLGGRLDATNVVDHDISIITSLAVDHVDWLGDDINVIGYEKAGIFRSLRPAICGQPDAPATVAAHADDIKASLYQIGQQYQYEVTSETTWSWKSGAFELQDLPIPTLPTQNAATALMALGQSGLAISDLDIVHGLKKAALPGRMQIIEQNPTVLLDVAHNPHSAEYLVNQVKEQYHHKNIHVVVGMLHDKDIESTLQILNQIAANWYPCSLEGPRAASAKELCRYLMGDWVEHRTPVDAFLSAKKQASTDDVILVVGSFHTVGEVLSYLD